LDREAVATYIYTYICIYMDSNYSVYLLYWYKSANVERSREDLLDREAVATYIHIYVYMYV
jgi:hypothetical protein